MTPFRDWSIQRKLTSILLITSGAVLVVTCAAFVVYESVTYKKEFAANVAAMAEVIGQGSVVSLEWKRPQQAGETLGALRSESQIRAACLYDEQGRLFAKFPPSQADNQFPRVEGESTRFIGGELHLFRPIRHPASQEIVGTLFIRCGLEKAQARMREFLLMAVLILALAAALAVVLAARFQRLFSHPILALARTAQSVSEQQNFALRATKEANDEVGRLIDSFNDMLAQIQRRDAELLAARESAEQAREEAEKANRLKSKFLSVMSHELRTPLSIIIQFLEIILPEVEAGGRKQWADWLGRSLGQAHHMLNQINDILDISRIEAGKMEVSLRQCEVTQIVEGGPMSGMPYLMRRNNNRFVIDCPPEPGQMWTDLDKVQRCLINLLGNASKFTKDGTVTLVVRRWSKDGAEWLTFRIQDTGKGMTPEELLKLFRPFSQASAGMGQQFGGHGLGLAITKELCQRLGGDVRVESEVGKGSTFIMDLPAERGGRAASEPALATAASGSLHTGSGSVLVIDDDPEVRQQLAELLQREGYEVELAGSGEEGLRRARAINPSIITLDALMPEMDGWAVLSELKKDPKLASIPVVMVSIWPETERAFALGVAEYLSKPVDATRLAAVLKKYHCPPPANRALVVEDDPDMRSLLRQMLESEHWAAATAENGQAALVEINRARPSLIILDLMMPVMDGFQLVAELQKRDDWRRIPVVVVTAKDVTVEDRKRLEGRAAEILKKGAFSRDELLQTVQQTVRQLRPETATFTPADPTTPTPAQTPAKV